MTKEVMKQALEALKEAQTNNDSAEYWDRNKNVIKALEEALKQEQGEQLARLGWQEIDCPICGGGARAFPKQKRGESIAWLEENSAKAISDLEKQAWIQAGRDELVETYNRPLYTKPQTKEWVKLTEEDKVLIKHDANYNQFMTAGEYADRVQALTEARLKDKNDTPRL